MASNPASLHQAMEDLEDVRSALAASALLMSHIAHCLGATLRQEAKRQRAERAEQRSSEPAKSPAPRKRQKRR